MKTLSTPLFRAKLQNYCHLAGKNQQDLARQMGFSYSTLNKKLNARRSLTLQDFSLLLTILIEWQVFQQVTEVTTFCQLAGYSLSELGLFLKEEQGLVCLMPSIPTPNKANWANLSPNARGTTPNNLPSRLNSFVGRRKELELINSYLAVGRWVTLVGPPGCGKTRLALEVARKKLANFKHGVWLVELAGIAEKEYVEELIASTLNVKEQPTATLLESLCHNLKGRELLLLIDNCEHLVEASRVILETLVQRCPELVIVATSREKLVGVGETVIEIGPLALPPAVTISKPGGASVKPKEWRNYDGITLFEVRARQAQSSFKLTQANIGIVMEVCQNLDGIPLALELAAARLQALSLVKIRTLLNERFRLLRANAGEEENNPVSLARHHQTLRGMLDRSYDLLNTTEQVLLSQLAVFRGSFGLEAAWNVCSFYGYEYKEGKLPAESELAKLLTGLVNKNLVQLQSSEQPSNEIRYRLLETIREYGWEHLEKLASERFQLEARHANYYMQLAEQAAPYLQTSAQATNWLQRLEQEFANLNAAFKWAIERQLPELALRLSGALSNFWYVQGRFRQGQDWLQKALALADNPTSIRYRVHALRSLGLLFNSTANHAEAQNYTQQSLLLCQQLDDRQGIAKCLKQLGMIASEQDNFAQTKDYYYQSLAIGRELDDKQSVASLLNNLGYLLIRLGEFEEANKLLQEVVAQRRTLGFKPGLANNLLNLAFLELRRGGYEVGIVYGEESLALYSETNSKLGQAHVLNTLGELYRRHGQHEKALQLQEAAVHLNEEIGDKRNLAKCYESLADLYYSEGNYPKAQASFLESLKLAKEANSKEAIACNLEGLAWVALNQGETARALQLVSNAARIREDFQLPLAQADRLVSEQNLAKLKERLGQEHFEHLWEAGRNLTLEQLISNLLLDKE